MLYLQDMYALSVQSGPEQGQALHVCSLKRLSCEKDQKYEWTNEQKRPTCCFVTGRSAPVCRVIGQVSIRIAVRSIKTSCSVSGQLHSIDCSFLQPAPQLAKRFSESLADSARRQRACSGLTEDGLRQTALILQTIVDPYSASHLL